MDGDRVWANGLADAFKKRGYSAFYIPHGLGALPAAQNYRPDCIVMNFDMPGAEADAVCGGIRAYRDFKYLPIIIVSADLAHEIHAYAKCRADIFIKKSYDFGKITAAAENLLRRISWHGDSVERGDLRLESKNHVLYRNSRPLFRLSSEQFQLLFLLLQKEGSFVDEQAISEELYDHSAQADYYDAIKMLVYRLRARLGPQLGRRIKNKRAQGWIYLRPGASSKTNPS